MHRPVQLPERPVQAVILAGGRGTRMKPLTDTRPKPMIEINRVPFLEHQVNQLREQGFKKILLLLGYLPEVVQNYFGDGSRWGVSIEYSVSAVDDETGRRIKLAESRLDPFFLLLYCDNYWPMQIDKMWPKFASSGAPAMITVYTNRDGYTRNNVRVDPDDYVAVYDKSNKTPGLQGVEISYALLDRTLIGRIPETNISVEESLYAPLVRERRLLAYVSEHRYYSVGGLGRLPLTEAFFSGEPAILLDRDGVLNRKPARAEYVRSWEQFEWLPGAKDALRLLKETGHRVVIVTNQAGIGRGMMSENDLAQINQNMLRDAEKAGGKIDAIYYCPHSWDFGCECRKPKPGLFFRAQKELHLDLSRTLYIGDDERDREAALAAGCQFSMATDGNTLFQITQQVANHGIQQ